MKTKSRSPKSIKANFEKTILQCIDEVQDHRSKNPTERETITPIETVAHVDLVVTNTGGDVLCLMGGDNAALPKALRLAHQIEGLPVEKKECLMPFQDCYEVDREFVLATCGTFTSWTWEQIVNLGKSMPAGAKYTYMVTV